MIAVTARTMTRPGARLYRRGFPVAGVLGILLLAACEESPESVVEGACLRNFSGEVCSCVVEKVSENGQLDRLAGWVADDSPAATAAIETAALLCR